MTTPSVRALILKRLALLGAELGKPELGQATDDTHLLGGQSPLDSMKLHTPWPRNSAANVSTAANSASRLGGWCQRWRRVSSR